MLTLYMHTAEESSTVFTQSIVYTVDASLIFSVKSTED